MQETFDHMKTTVVVGKSAFRTSLPDIPCGLIPSDSKSPELKRLHVLQGTCRRVALITFTAIVSVAMIAADASAQTEPRKHIELYGGGRRLNSPPPPRPNAPTPAAREAVPPPRPQLPQQVLTQARELEEQSTQAFQRGLLPLTDYLEHMRTVYEVERRDAIDRQDRRALLNAAQANVARLNLAAEQLAAFRQPAAEGWEADVMLARAAAAEASGELATVNGNRSEAELAKQKFQEFAWRHLQAVEFDRRVLGLSSLPTMVTAITMAAGDQSGADLERKSELQRYMVLTTEQWNVAGAGIGRDDAVSEARAEEAATQAKLALITKDMPGFASEIARAEQAALKLFSERLDYYRNGTASLSDLTQTMLLRSRIQNLASSVDGIDMQPIRTRWEQDLRELTSIADSIQDRRGRNQADVLFVNVLNQMNQASPVHQRDDTPRRSPTPAP